MEITVKKNEQAGRYEALTDDGTVAGFADYRVSGDSVVFPHTVTEREFGGQGVASKVAKAALDDVRKAGKKAVPSCSFFADYIERHPEYADLV